MNLYNYHTHSFSLYIVNNKFAKLGHDSFFLSYLKNGLLKIQELLQT